jgi:AcrR family transcriptional regulator
VFRDGYNDDMPRLWNDTIESHRHAVRQATLDTTADLVAEKGLRSVTMSEIATRTGIGRATLYKYFPDVETILAAWHQRQIAHHLEHLAKVRDAEAEPGRRLKAVLTAYAHIHRERVYGHHNQPHGADLAAFLHQDTQLGGARQELFDMIRQVVAEAAETGHIRDDLDASELTGFSIHALEAAAHAPSEDAVNRLVAVTLDGMSTKAGG